MDRELLKRFIKGLFDAYESLITYNPRINPVLRDQLMITMKPQVLQATIKEFQQGEGDIGYITEESMKLAEPIAQVVTQRQHWHNGQMRPLDRGQVEIYIQNYYKLEVLFRIIHARGDLQ